MLTNIVGGLQGIIDHALVGHLVGFTGNAAIGVSWQIILVVIVFISSLFSGMGVLVARFAGAGDSDKVDRTVYQAFLTATFLSFGVMAPLGYFASPWLLEFVNAAPAVKAEALPFLRIMFVFVGGMMTFFLLSAALRSAGDARTPMMLGIAMTVLNLAFNVMLIRGLGPIPPFGTKGSAMGTAMASGLVAVYSMWKLVERSVGRVVSARPRLGPRLAHHSIAVPLRASDRHPGDCDEHRRRAHARRSSDRCRRAPRRRRPSPISYSQLFSLITWTSVGLMGAAAAVAGQNLGAGPAGSRRCRGARGRALRDWRRCARLGFFFWCSRVSCSRSSV